MNLVNLSNSKPKKTIVLRKANQRGHANHGWLDSYHTFSFANYYDPDYMGFRSLRVINEDRIQGGKGFATHSHRDMEIISYVLEGALEHKDTMGNVTIIRPGEVQRMSAGTGVSHSEYNHSPTKTAHFLQIWVLPEQAGLPPGYEQKFYEDSEKQNQFCLIASPDGSNNSVTIHQDVCIYASKLDMGRSLVYSIRQNRHLWLQVLGGKINLEDNSLGAGDGAAISGGELIELTGIEAAEILIFDLD
jgi:quercetin 2,3-dioxygenase